MTPQRKLQVLGRFKGFQEQTHGVSKYEWARRAVRTVLNEAPSEWEEMIRNSATNEDIFIEAFIQGWRDAEFLKGCGVVT